MKCYKCDMCGKQIKENRCSFILNTYGCNERDILREGIDLCTECSNKVFGYITSEYVAQGGRVVMHKPPNPDDWADINENLKD